MRHTGTERQQITNEELLQQIIDLGRRLVGARYGALGLLRRDGRGFSRFITSGMKETAAGAVYPVPDGHGLAGVLIRDPRPLRAAATETLETTGMTESHPRLNSFLGVPLVCRGKVCGNLYFTEKIGWPEFPPTDIRLLQSFARWASEAAMGISAPEEIQKCLALFRSALDERTAAVTIVDPRREFILWSRKARALFGYTEKEVLGRRVEEVLVPPEETGEWKRNFLRRVAQDLLDGKQVHCEGTRLHKDGRRIHVRMILSPVVHDAAGVRTATTITKMRPVGSTAFGLPA